jgi:hypothetical protein
MANGSVSCPRWTVHPGNPVKLSTNAPCATELGAAENVEVLLITPGRAGLAHF